jgi:hypothetical protein
VPSAGFPMSGHPNEARLQKATHQLRFATQ